MTAARVTPAVIDELTAGDHPRVRKAAQDIIAALIEAGPQGIKINYNRTRESLGRIGTRPAQKYVWTLTRDRLLESGLIKVTQSYKVGLAPITFALTDPPDACLAKAIGRYCAVEIDGETVKGWLLSFDEDTITVRLPVLNHHPRTFPRHSFRSLDKAQIYD